MELLTTPTSNHGPLIRTESTSFLVDIFDWPDRVSPQFQIIKTSPMLSEGNLLWALLCKCMQSSPLLETCSWWTWPGQSQNQPHRIPSPAKIIMHTHQHKFRESATPLHSPHCQKVNPEANYNNYVYHSTSLPRTSAHKHSSHTPHTRTHARTHTHTYAHAHAHTTFMHTGIAHYAPVDPHLHTVCTQSCNRLSELNGA